MEPGNLAIAAANANLLQCQALLQISCCASGAWDVDDRGLEYMPSKDVAQRIQKKVNICTSWQCSLAHLASSDCCDLQVFGMYARGTLYSVLAMTLICKL